MERDVAQQLEDYQRLLDGLETLVFVEGQTGGSATSMRRSSMLSGSSQLTSRTRASQSFIHQTFKTLFEAFSPAVSRIRATSSE